MLWERYYRTAGYQGSCTRQPEFAARFIPQTQTYALESNLSPCFSVSWFQGRAQNYENWCHQVASVWSLKPQPALPTSQCCSLCSFWQFPQEMKELRFSIKKRTTLLQPNTQHFHVHLLLYGYTARVQEQNLPLRQKARQIVGRASLTNYRKSFTTLLQVSNLSVST